MPNHVRNKILMKGIDEIFGSEGGDFDFNKIIPMPEELNVPSGSPETDGIIAVLYALTKQQDTVLRLNANIVIDRFYIEEMNKLKPDKLKTKQAEGLKYIRNLIEYGHTTWYDWAIEHWGTKWNAYETEWFPDGVDFLTAWSNPEPVVMKLAEMFPDAEIEHWWADEDAGNNAGHRLFSNGEWIEDAPDEQGMLEIYVDLWGEDEFIFRDENGLLKRRED